MLDQKQRDLSASNNTIVPHMLLIAKYKAYGINYDAYEFICC